MNAYNGNLQKIATQEAAKATAVYQDIDKRLKKININH